MIYTFFRDESKILAYNAFRTEGLLSNYLRFFNIFNFVRFVMHQTNFTVVKVFNLLSDVFDV